MMGRAVFLLLCIGCGGATSEARPAAIAKAEVASADAKVLPQQPSSSLRRSLVRAVVKSGLGAFLQNVPVDAPVFLAGKFHGFRIAQVPADWRGVDLRAGDVVTSVNGFSIERPESAFEAFQSLEVASELRVDYERNGEPRALRFSIVDD